MRAAVICLLFCSGCVSPVVGAACADGYAQCGGACVDLSSDPSHCGACDHACPAEAICSAGACVTTDEPAVEPGRVGSGSAPRSSSEPRPRGPAVLVGPRPLDPAPVCELGELRCGERCVRPDTDPEHCGGCGRACAGDEVCAGGACAARCEEPFAWCDGACVDLGSDPDNCGGCGIRCGTGVCEDSRCRAPLAGHVVVIGHDYTERRRAMGRIVGNAVMLASGSHVEVLTYEGTVAPPSRRGTDASIDEVATSMGRTWGPMPTPADELSYHLARADVLLVYAQPGLSAADGIGLGLRWRKAIEGFLAVGGTVVFLVGGDGDGGTPSILEGAALTGARPERTDVTGALLDVTRPSDALAVGVPLRYRAERTTVRLGMPLAEAVVTDGTAPVVVHRTVAGP